MKRNSLKIVSNSNMKSISYYFQNERGEWVRVSNSSILSRKEYVQANFIDKVKDILREIIELYNPGNCGVDIHFEGADVDFSILQSTIDEYYSQENIKCVLKNTKVAVAGKVGSGKTTLIEAIGNYIKCEFEVKRNDNYISYKEVDGNTVWYELDGIDIGPKSIDATETIINEFVSKGLSTFIYCFGTNKIEEMEEAMLIKIKKSNPEINVLALLTFCVDNDAEFYAEQMSKQLWGINVIPVLAKDFKSRMGIVTAYGIGDVTNFVLGGKRNG